MTIGELKALINDLPDDANILYEDPFSEFSYRIASASHCMSKVEFITKDGVSTYDSMPCDNINEFVKDQEMDEDERNKFFALYNNALLMDLEY